MSSTTRAASSSSTPSSRCVPFAFRRGGGARGRLPAPAGARTVAHGSAPAAAGCCGRPLCRPAEILGEGIQNAFFASLDACSCVKVGTVSFKESSESDTTHLIMSPPLSHSHDDSGSVTSARTRRASNKPPRRGLGCCTPKTTSVN